MNILEASLLNRRHGGLRVVSDGRQHVRAWVEGNFTYLLIADFANEGSAHLFNEHVLPRPTLPLGERVKGAVTIEISATASP